MTELQQSDKPLPQTPRTDTVWKAIGNLGHDKYDLMVKHARQLERELAACRLECNEIRRVNISMREQVAQRPSGAMPLDAGPAFDAWLDETRPAWRPKNQGSVHYYAMKAAWLYAAKLFASSSTATPVAWRHRFFENGRWRDWNVSTGCPASAGIKELFGQPFEQEPLYAAPVSATAPTAEVKALRKFYTAWKEIKEYGGRYTMDMAEAEEEIKAAGVATDETASKA